MARNTVTRWEMGIRGIPEPVVRLLEFLRKEDASDKEEGKEIVGEKRSAGVLRAL